MEFFKTKKPLASE